jgi:hypothetical protein
MPTEILDRQLIERPPVLVQPETAGFSKVLLANATIPANAEKRLWPGLDVSKWDRLHFTIGADARAVPSLNVRILFSTPIPGLHCGGILTGSTIWYEQGASEVTFEHTTPAGFGSTGFTMSVPVIAPVLYDVILRNVGTLDLQTVHVALFAQEI